MTNLLFSISDHDDPSKGGQIVHDCMKIGFTTKEFVEMASQCQEHIRNEIWKLFIGNKKRSQLLSVIEHAEQVFKAAALEVFCECHMPATIKEADIIRRYFPDFEAKSESCFVKIKNYLTEDECVSLIGLLPTRAEYYADIVIKKYKITLRGVIAILEHVPSRRKEGLNLLFSVGMIGFNAVDFVRLYMKVPELKPDLQRFIKINISHFSINDLGELSEISDLAALAYAGDHIQSIQSFID